MPAFLLTWNPNKWPWEDLPELAARVRRGEEVQQSWSSGGRRSMPLGARVFMLRQGVEPKGVFGSGWVVDVPRLGEHWDIEKRGAGIQELYVTFVLDALLDPAQDGPLDLRSATTGPLSRVNVNVQRSGTQVADEGWRSLEKRWARHTERAALEPTLPQQEEVTGYEGELRRAYVAHRHRERALRAAKLKERALASPDGRLRCEVPGCGFDFAEVYGHVGANYAQVHHLTPLSAHDEPVQTTLKDLAVVCANCHAMIHVGGKCRPLSELIRQPAPNASRS
jgi:5-methylcytosine-specific restriction protein A